MNNATWLQTESNLTERNVQADAKFMMPQSLHEPPFGPTPLAAKN